MSRVNIVKRIKINGLWKMFSIPRNAKGNYDWNAIADGRYYVEWYIGGTRRREGAGVTAAQLPACRPDSRRRAGARPAPLVAGAGPGLRVGDRSQSVPRVGDSAAAPAHPGA